MSATRPTLDHIAKEAGVSRSTVSVVLHATRSGTRVSTQTRQRVLAVAEKLSYHPNSLARSLRGHRTHVIGVFYGFDPRLGKSPFFLEIVSGLQVAASDLKLDLLLHTSPNAGTEEDLIRKLCDGRNDGLILAAWPPDHLAELIVRAGLPSVALVESVPNLPLVTVDAAQSARLQVEHLVQRGHRKILALFPRSIPGASVDRRLSALIQTAREAGIDLATRTYISETTPPEKVLSEEDSAWIMEPNGPTAVTCWADETADLLCSQLESAGVAVPKDVAVVGFNGIRLGLQPRWDLTTIEADWQRVAYASLCRLESMILGEEGPAETHLPVKLHIGATT